MKYFILIQLSPTSEQDHGEAPPVRTVVPGDLPGCVTDQGPARGLGGET